MGSEWSLTGIEALSKGQVAKRLCGGGAKKAELQAGVYCIVASSLQFVHRDRQAQSDAHTHVHLSKKQTRKGVMRPSSGEATLI
jgi:hypothetical protein